ncbi:hypothetical protein HPP92_009047 [Vanilla planifolia]|uniref:Uncharacterized protein n=1 Tax=Vanilla planifolia TaxID=51239 RepID=A0A835REH9_VANPL|nr:hypothetical protein HPP92_009047 [Vanilla planifolia]
MDVATVKKKVIVVMGATGAGKSRLALSLASHFPAVEIINADSMQVYRGLDVLTNKITPAESQGVPNHLLGNIDPSVEFTCKDFRDLAIPIIDDVLSRNRLPIIVGGTNYYIQALVSPYLADDVVEDMAEDSRISRLTDVDLNDINSASAFKLLNEIDPIAANRIHPNDQRKIQHYLSLYSTSGILPSTLFLGDTSRKWGRADNFRYNCCFIWVDAALPLLDRYVNDRVDSMIAAGLLNEVFDIYKPKSDYTRGLKQAIGVREFDEFFRAYFAADSSWVNSLTNDQVSSDDANMFTKPKLSGILNSHDSNTLRALLIEAIDKFKANTRKLLRRQRRRLNRLKSDFGWKMQYIDATKAFQDESDNSWSVWVVEPCVKIVRSFLLEQPGFLSSTGAPYNVLHLTSKDLCTQYVCEACGNRVLRGAHEWEQHRRGRVHKKRASRLNKCQRTFSVDQQAAKSADGELNSTFCNSP